MVEKNRGAWGLSGQSTGRLSSHNEPMPSDALWRLWKLHLVDHAILEIRARAAALDPGRKILAEIQELETQYAEVGGRAKALHQEITDAELQTKTIDEKLKKIDRDLYGGKVVNPREVEALQKEIEMLKAKRSELDERILELWELHPPAKAAADAVEQAIAKKKLELADHQRKALQLKTQLEKAFKERSAERPLVAKNVEAPLLARYDMIRQKQGGVGMAKLKPNDTCEECGMTIPRKTVLAVREDGAVQTCESCHRILYYSESVAE